MEEVHEYLREYDKNSFNYLNVVEIILCGIVCALNSALDRYYLPSPCLSSRLKAMPLYSLALRIYSMPETIDGHTLSTFLPVAVNTGLGPNLSISDIRRFFSIMVLLIETFKGVLILNFFVGVYPVLAVGS